MLTGGGLILEVVICSSTQALFAGCSPQAVLARPLRRDREGASGRLQRAAPGGATNYVYIYIYIYIYIVVYAMLSDIVLCYII